MIKRQSLCNFYQFPSKIYTQTGVGIAFTPALTVPGMIMSFISVLRWPLLTMNQLGTDPSLFFFRYLLLFLDDTGPNHGSMAFTQTSCKAHILINSGGLVRAELNPPILYIQETCHLSLCIICSCHYTAHAISYDNSQLMA